MDAADDFCNTTVMANLLVVDHPTEADRSAILDLLVEFNSRNAPPAAVLPLAIHLKDLNGETIGGLSGASGYDWLFIELVFVPANLRATGLGSRLVKRAESIAEARGCTGVWLNTFSFQALGFYEKMGYRLFGEITDHPVGGALYFLQKRMGAPAQSAHG